MTETLLTVLGVVFTAVVGFLGVRVTASKTSKAASESVAVTALNHAMNGWIERSKITDADLQATKQDLKETKAHYDLELRKLRVALTLSRQYVTTLLTWIENQLPGAKPPDPPQGYYDDQ